MRFVDVNPYFFPYKGGIERRMDDIKREMKEVQKDRSTQRQKREKLL